MSTNLSTPLSLGDLEALSRKKGEPSWLTDARTAAASAAESLEWPRPEKMRIERWNLGAFGVYKEPAAVSGAAELPEEIRGLLPEGTASLVVQRNSGAVLRQLPQELAAKGVIFTDLETAAREHGELVREHLFSAQRADENRLTALHAALWNGGVFLYVPRNVEIELPMQALLFQDDAEATFAPHILIIADANSSVTYTDYVVSAEGTSAPSVHSAVAEVIVKAGAKVRFASVHHMAQTTIDLTLRRAVVENDGRVEWILGDLHDGNTLSETLSVLKGNGSSSDAKVISVGTGSQNMSLTTEARHIGRSSESGMVTRAVMRDSATAIINGITKIEKGAAKANGQQTEKVLMLSPKARGDANPILLIDEDDVKAGHAASVGQVNPEQIYYLMSRGISKREAERLIINGFLEPVVAEIPLEAVRDQLHRLLERKLGS